MATGGDAEVPTPRKLRRRRLSRRRFWRRVGWGVFLFGLLLIGTRPALHTLGSLSSRRGSQATMEWDVVRISRDRRAVVIRVSECGTEYVGTQVTRLGANVELTVSVRLVNGAGTAVMCAPFADMPTHLVHLGFALPSDGSVLASGCPLTECDDAGPT